MDVGTGQPSKASPQISKNIELQTHNQELKAAIASLQFSGPSCSNRGFDSIPGMPSSGHEDIPPCACVASCDVIR